MMHKRSAEDVLESMIQILLTYVDELFVYKNDENHQFQYGERLAYTECLEMLQEWKYAPLNGLYFNVEEKYPL